MYCVEFNFDPVIREALRFRPVFPFLVRYCPRATQLESTAPDRRREVAAGSVVNFSPLMAMFDAASVERPETFIPSRPKDVYHLFGGGTRVCTGEKLVMSMFQPMLRELLRHVPGLCELDHPGRFRYDGFAVEHYIVRPPPRSAEFVDSVAVEAADEGHMCPHHAVPLYRDKGRRAPSPAEHVFTSKHDAVSNSVEPRV